MLGNSHSEAGDVAHCCGVYEALGAVPSTRTNTEGKMLTQVPSALSQHGLGLWRRALTVVSDVIFLMPFRAHSTTCANKFLGAEKPNSAALQNKKQKQHNGHLREQNNVLPLLGITSQEV